MHKQAVAHYHQQMGGVEDNFTMCFLSRSWHHSRFVYTSVATNTRGMCSATRLAWLQCHQATGISQLHSNLTEELLCVQFAVVH